MEIVVAVAEKRVGVHGQKSRAFLAGRRIEHDYVPAGHGSGEDAAVGAERPIRDRSATAPPKAAAIDGSLHFEYHLLGCQIVKPYGRSVARVNDDALAVGRELGLPDFVLGQDDVSGVELEDAQLAGVAPGDCI